MKILRGVSIGGKILMGFIVMILLLGVIGFSGYWSTKQIEAKLEVIFQRNLPSIDYLLETDRDLQQLLVAERSAIFANASSEVFKQLVEEYETNLKQAAERWEKYKKLAVTAEETALFDKYEKAREEWQVVSRKIMDGRIADTREGRREALDLTLGLAKAKFEEMRNFLDQLTGINLDAAQVAHDAAGAAYQKSIFALLTVVTAGLLIGMLLAWGITRGVTKPLNAVIGGMTQASDQTASASQQISSASQQLAEGASEQASSLEETSASLEEMASGTRQNAANAGQADSLVKEANAVVAQANTSMRELTQSMEEISKASEETSKIIKTIDEIAFQTNLLALNAAVEAARAGEAGAGFAVVADEVRNLAMRAAEAAKNTAQLIEGTVKKVKGGSDLVTKTNDDFTRVADSSAKVGELVSEIASASNEQAQGIEQINRAVTEMDRVVQQNASNAEESASASEEMYAQAEEMKTYVQQLASVVGGNGGGKASREKTPAALKSAQSSAPGKLKKPMLQATALPVAKGKSKTMDFGKKEVSPEEVIPFDDEELRDF